MSQVTLAANDSLRLDRLTLGHWQTNCYILTCVKTLESLVVDAPAEAPRMIESLKGTTPKYILITHGHHDHTGALASLHAGLKVPVAIHSADTLGLPTPEMLLKDGDTISVGRLRLEVLHTPGHTPGSLCFRCGKYLLAGDTIFQGGPGHTQTPTAFRQIVKSLEEKVFPLDGDTEIHPGHGEPTVLATEKAEFAVFSAKPHSPELCGDVLWLA